VNELLGVGAALLGSLLGGTAVAGTRYAVGALEPLGVATLRYAIGALCLAPIALFSLRKLSTRRDIVATITLGALFYAIYPFFFTLALAHTTAARGALALATLPLLTLGLAIVLRRESFSWQRLVGILIAIGGLAYALSPKLDSFAPAAWKGDLIMIGAATLQAIYNVLSRRYIERIGALPFTAFGMCVGAILLVAVSAAAGVSRALPGLDGTAWAAIIYLGVIGCGLTFVLWSVGLQFASPVLVGLTVTLNAVTASLLGALFLAEPIGQELVLGLAAVLLGIAVATKIKNNKSMS